MKNIIYILAFLLSFSAFGQPPAGNTPMYPEAIPQTRASLANWVNNTTELVYQTEYAEDEFGTHNTIVRVADQDDADFNSDMSIAHDHASLPAFQEANGTTYLRLGENSATWRWIDTEDYSVVPFTYSQGEARCMSMEVAGRAYWYYGGTVLYASERNMGTLTGSRVNTDMLDFSDPIGTTGLQNVYTNMQFNSAHFNFSHNDIGAMVGTTDGTDVWVVVIDLKGLFDNPNDGGTYVLHETELTWLDWANNYDGADGLRWIKVDSDGTHIVVGYFTDEAVPGTDTGTSTRGIWSYPVGNITVAGGTQLTTQRNHSNLAVNAAGDDVLITNDFGHRGFFDSTSTVVVSNGDNRYNYAVSEIRISDGLVTGLYWPDATDTKWGYTSGNNHKRLGYAAFSFTGSISDAASDDGALICGMFKLDGGGHATLGPPEGATFEPYGRCYNEQADAGAENEKPHGNPNSDGTIMVWRATYTSAGMNPNNTATAVISKVYKKRRTL